MTVPRQRMEELIYGKGARRFTQDSPVLPDVWTEYGREHEDQSPRRQLLLTPLFGSRPGRVARELRLKLGRIEAEKARVSYNQTYVAVDLDLPELVSIVLPMTRWWREHVLRSHETGGSL